MQIDLVNTTTIFFGYCIDLKSVPFVLHKNHHLKLACLKDVKEKWYTYRQPSSENA